MASLLIKFAVFTEFTDRSFLHSDSIYCNEKQEMNLKIRPLVYNFYLAEGIKMNNLMFFLTVHHSIDFFKLPT
jgi:hypothetical protein